MLRMHKGGAMVGKYSSKLEQSVSLIFQRNCVVMFKTQQLRDMKWRLTGHLMDADNACLLQQLVYIHPCKEQVDPESILFERRTASWHDLPAQNFRLTLRNPEKGDLRNDWEPLKLVLAETIIPFAKEYSKKKKEKTFGMHRLYVSVQVDDSIDELLANYAVIEDTKTMLWTLTECFHFTKWKQTE